MITLLFIGCLIWLVAKMVGLAFAATWGILKVVGYILVFPAFLIGLVVSGLISIAFPLLIIAGLIAIVKPVLS